MASLLPLNKVFSTQSLLILQGARFYFWNKTSKKQKGRGALRTTNMRSHGLLVSCMGFWKVFL